MKGKIRRLGVLFGSLVPLALDASAGLLADEFAVIAQKNVFRLCPPGRHAEPVVLQPDLPKVGLQGIMTILGSREALLKIQTKIKAASTEISYILREGQFRDGVLVTKIDADSGTVWLMNQGVERILKIKE